MKYSKKQIKEAVIAAVTDTCHRVDGLGVLDAFVVAPALAEAVIGRLEGGKAKKEKSEEEVSLEERGLNAACHFLESKGYDVIERSWECDAGEISLVALDGGTLVFADVVSQVNDGCGYLPNLGMDDDRDRLERIALAYVEEHDVGDVAVRFDLVSVCIVKGSRALIRHHLGAYSH